MVFVVADAGAVADVGAVVADVAVGAGDARPILLRSTIFLSFATHCAHSATVSARR